ncbi:MULTISPECIES: hypothetical protein [Brevibacillus]|uniref:hypothetical protein n=1 Tax=Brevibacillus TaxID=55080 RepID=UPI0015EF18A7|nr:MULTISPECIES: hypothetical protein [Brevibacillus]MBA4531475.1 hypothetical protein [Brevibacillus halotolerans]MCR8961831.1 hypothetical protein [Brevibacillus laterosporus]MCZ0833986.1 hypothetical protein [Brevibacillus halotolerans]
MSIGNKRLIGGIISGIAVLAIVGYNLFKYMQGQQLGFSDLISIPIILMFFFNTISWNSAEEQRDELGQLITCKSAKISYFALMIVILIVFLCEEAPFHSHQPIKNMSLFLVLCASTVILPAVEFIVSRRFR